MILDLVSRDFTGKKQWLSRVGKLHAEVDVNKIKWVKNENAFYIDKFNTIQVK